MTLTLTSTLHTRAHSHDRKISCSNMLNYNFLVVRLRKSRHANLCSKNQFFRENVVVVAFSELRPGSNERYENSTFYGPFRFLIFILIFVNRIL